MSLFRRRLLRQQQSTLLYEKEVEYLQSDGNQYFTLPVAPSEVTDAFEITFRLTNTSAQQRFCHTEASDGLFQMYSNSSKRAAYSIKGSWTAFSSNAYSLLGTVKHTYKVDYKNKKASFDFYVKTLSSSTSVSTGNLVVTGKYGSNAQFQGLIYSVKFWRDDVLLYDLVPVRKNGVGYFFNKIDNTLFANEGTGSWTIGIDKLNNINYYTVLDYLENTSTAATAPYIDTGVSSNAGVIQMELTAKWNTVASDKRQLFGNVSNPWFGCDNGEYKSSGGTTYPDIDPPSTTAYTTFTMNSYTLPSDTTAQNIAPLALFRLYQASSRDNSSTTYICSCKLKRFKITVDGVLVRDFVPVLHPLGKYGMFDLIENKFYMSANSGNFTGGFDA